jgi:hypothetical protein
MDDNQASEAVPVPRSAAATLALAGIGLIGAGNRRLRPAVGLGLRAAGVVVIPLRRVPLVAPVRRAGSAVLSTLAAEGGDREARWRAELEATLTERIVDAATRAVVEHEIVERVAAQLIDAGTLERVAEQVTDSPLPLRLVDDMLTERVTDPIAARVFGSAELDRLLERMLASPALDALLAKLLDSPSTDRIVARTVASPGLERLVVTVMESRLVDDLTERVIESEELQRVVSHVAKSPELRTAIAQSSASMAGEVADQVRTRTVVADESAERVARRLLRRKPIIRMGPPDPAGAGGAG